MANVLKELEEFLKKKEKPEVVKPKEDEPDNIEGLDENSKEMIQKLMKMNEEMTKQLQTYQEAELASKKQALIDQGVPEALVNKLSDLDDETSKEVIEIFNSSNTDASIATGTESSEEFSLEELKKSL